MLEANASPTDKRRAFRERLASGELLVLPGAMNPLSAMLIEEHGFDGIYVSGAVLSADLGLPDIGLTTLTEVATRSQQMARVTDLPALVDADTGFGEPMNVARSVQVLEDAGVAGLHLEDQVNPKRCGHLDGKQVVDEATAGKRIRAAVQSRRDPDFLIMARSDIRGVEDLAATIDRLKALVDAGADAVFPEALASLDEFAAVRAAVDVPILANVTEFGRSDLFTHAQLRDVGVNLVIHPVSLLRLAMGAAERGLKALKAEGTLAGLLPEMQTRARLYELLDYAGTTAFDEGVYTFDLSHNRSN
jgi:methylisocitrate lyase